MVAWFVVRRPKANGVTGVVTGFQEELAKVGIEKIPDTPLVSSFVNGHSAETAAEVAQTLAKIKFLHGGLAGGFVIFLRFCQPNQPDVHTQVLRRVQPGRGAAARSRAAAGRPARGRAPVH